MFEYYSGRIVARLEKTEKELINNIRFSIENGGTLALTGKTGAGKTTIASSVMGLLAENIYADGGYVILNGTEIPYEERRKKLGRQIVYIPQSGHECLNKSRTVKKHFLDSGYTSGFEDLLKLVGFDDAASVLNMYPFELSGGMAQRVVIALAALSEPDLIIADEPTNGIDESFREEFLALINNVFPDASKLIITHDSVLAASCDAIVNLDEASGKASADSDKVTESVHGTLLKNAPHILMDAECRTCNDISSESILLRIENVSKSFGEKTILNSACAEIPAGSFVGLCGKSGGGKSTLAKIITGLEMPDKGKIIFEGNSLYDENGHYNRRKALEVQMVYQQPYAVLDPSQKIRKGLKELIRYHGIDCSGDADAYLDKKAADFGLNDEILNHLPVQISGGEAQRAAILKCLLLKPKLLILDEATSMLDAATQSSILSIIENEMRKNGGSVLMISHESELVKAYCQQIYQLENGQMKLAYGLKERGLKI